MSDLRPIAVEIEPAKLASSPSAVASSLSVLRASGAASTTEAIPDVMAESVSPFVYTSDLTYTSIASAF